MVKKGHLFLGSTETQNNRLLWDQRFHRRTISTEFGRATENELVPALKNYFSWYCLQVLIMLHVSADSTYSLQR